MGYDGNNETLYIKLDRSALRYEADFYIKDLGGIECSNSDILARVKAHAVYHFKHPGNMPVSITKVVEEIHSLYPKLTVVSLGETDVIMEYRSKEPEPFMQVAKTDSFAYCSLSEQPLPSWHFTTISVSRNSLTVFICRSWEAKSLRSVRWRLHIRSDLRWESYSFITILARRN